MENSALFAETFSTSKVIFPDLTDNAIFSNISPNLSAPSTPVLTKLVDIAVI